VALLEAAAATGISSALSNLGQAYLSGTGVAADPVKARDYLERAAAAGDQTAQRKLAVALIMGDGLPKDAAKGFQLLEAAASDPQTLTSLGRFYLEGAAVEKDIPKAVNYFEEAARQGEYSGLEVLGSSYLSGEHTPKDIASAQKYLVRAAEGGRGSAWVRLARAAASGLLGPDSPALYTKFERSARAVKASGIDIVDAERYFWAQGVKENPAIAIEKLELAAKAGNSEAMVYLIDLYRDGRKNVANRSIAKAKQYLSVYAAKLPDAVRARQQVLLSLAMAAGPNDYQSLLDDPSAAAVLADPEAQSRVWKTNPNFVVYRLQAKLRSSGKYSGPLNGLATAATLRSMRAACSDRKDDFKCGPMLLKPRVIYSLTFQ
jgi:TPR repeat protein